MDSSYNIVVSRACSADDIHILRQFQCCHSDGSAHEWELDPQRYIRGLSRKDFDEPVVRMILTTETSEKVFAFVEYGYLEESDAYTIVWVARSIDCAGKSLGESLVKIVIDDIAIDAATMKRNNMVFTQINPENSRSIALFSNLGFTDNGKDLQDPEFHIWSKRFTPHSNMQVRHEFITQDLLHP